MMAIQVKKISVCLDDGSREEFIQDNESAAKITALIRDGRIETIHSKEPTLETVFLELTGKQLEEA